MPVGEKNGRLVTGFYQPRSHRIIETEKPCNIQDPAINAIIETVRDASSDLGIQAYNEKTHQGTLRHIVVRYGRNIRSTMVLIVTKTEIISYNHDMLPA